jgi:hypothetical protein
MHSLDFDFITGGGVLLLMGSPGSPRAVEIRIQFSLHDPLRCVGKRGAYRRNGVTSPRTEVKDGLSIPCCRVRILDTNMRPAKMSTRSEFR